MAGAERLRRLIDGVERGQRRRLPRTELAVFARLYRQSVAELAQRRAAGESREQLAFLEAQVIRAHAVLYSPRAARPTEALAGLWGAFPRAVRAAWRPTVLSALCLALGAVFGAYEVDRDPASAALLLPGELLDNAEESFQASNAALGSPMRGAFYFSHNASVAFSAFALGTTFGLGTLLSLFFNGVVLGATTAVVAAAGVPRELLGFVLPHAGIELAAICLAGGAGLRMGWALVKPGWVRRPEALARAARSGLPLVLGAAVVLAAAGLLEGWVSPMRLPIAVKAAIGGAATLALGAYVCSAGRRPAGTNRARRGPAGH